MIRMIFSGCQWGADPIDDGIQINLLDAESQIIAHVPFQGDALFELVKIGLGQIPPEKRRELSQVVTGGIVLPGLNGMPDNAGPQG